jgi:hypothetical protein
MSLNQQVPEGLKAQEVEHHLISHQYRCVYKFTLTNNLMPQTWIKIQAHSVSKYTPHLYTQYTISCLTYLCIHYYLYLYWLYTLGCITHVAQHHTHQHSHKDDAELNAMNQDHNIVYCIANISTLLSVRFSGSWSPLDL